MYCVIEISTELWVLTSQPWTVLSHNITSGDQFWKVAAQLAAVSGYSNEMLPPVSLMYEFKSWPHTLKHTFKASLINNL